MYNTVRVEQAYNSTKEEIQLNKTNIYSKLEVKLYLSVRGRINRSNILVFC